MVKEVFSQGLVLLLCTRNYQGMVKCSLSWRTKSRALFGKKENERSEFKSHI